MPQKTTDTAAADVTQQLAQSPNWGQAGSFVLDPATGERITEAESLARQTNAPAPTTTTPSKGG